MAGPGANCSALGLRMVADEQAVVEIHVRIIRQMLGDEDGSTPPDLVRETADLIKGSAFHLIRGAGHLPCVENPVEYAAVLTGFIKDIGHA